MRKKYIPKSGLDVGIQIIQMKKYFPGMRYFRFGGQQYWIGELKPFQYSDTYNVKICFRGKKSPNAFVLSPILKEDRPHKYPDGSLCLYYPREQKWKPDWIIAQKFMPWVCEYLYFYEVWLETDIWYGDEAPHKGKKILER